MMLHNSQNLKKLKKRNQGFTMLIAVVASTVLLALTIVIFNVSIKQVLLSNVGKDSQVALYAADSGIECALYWDGKGANGESQFMPETNSGSGGSITCNNASITTGTSDTIVDSAVIGGGSTYPKTSIFQLDLGSNVCAIIKVTKELSTPSDPTSNVKTTIDSRGYNTCIVTSPQRLERGLVVHY